MTPLDGALLVSGFVLLLVALSLALRLAERRWPRFRRFLDERWPEGEAWREW